MRTNVCFATMSCVASEGRAAVVVEDWLVKIEEAPSRSATTGATRIMLIPHCKDAGEFNHTRTKIRSRSELAGNLVAKC